MLYVLPTKSNTGRHQLEDQVDKSRVGQSPFYTAHHKPPPQEGKKQKEQRRQEKDNFLYQ